MDQAATFRLDTRDEARFNDLMRGTYRKVYNLAYRLSGNRPDAEDLTQDAFFRAYRSFKDFEGDKPFENWIFRIVTRLFLDLLRSRRRRVKAVSYDAPLNPEGYDDTVRLDAAAPNPSPEHVLLDATLSDDLQRAMAGLSPDQRLLIQLADIDEMPYAEIAKIMNRPVGTIRSRLHRTHRLLRSRLEQIRAEKEREHQRTPKHTLRLVPSL